MNSFAAFGCFLVFGLAFGQQPVPYLKGLSRNSINQPYIVGGEDAEDGKFPYMISLRYSEDKKHFCGGSILTKNYVLTAAHCCLGMNNHSVLLVAGTNSLIEGGEEYFMDNYKVHPKYNPLNHWVFDSCVIKLKSPFNFSEKIAQVTVPPMDWPIKGGDLLNVTGWGYTKPNAMMPSEKLQLGRDYIALDHDQCYKKTNRSHVSYLCAFSGKKGRGICNGDSGSPITKNGVQVGVASWVFIPCGSGLPDFYVRVPKIMDWIEKALGDDAKDLKRFEE